ncbi:MAG: hypothetical protein COA62_11870 [Rhodobiaceae bacterium]|nr:MAG: hypothetical protein COA62_11870 [Rhodobiaceae bacterium]
MSYVTSAIFTHPKINTCAPSTLGEDCGGEVSVGLIEPYHLPVVGVLQAGAWMERVDPEKAGTVPVTLDQRYAKRHQYALKVQGQSMNQLVQHGDYVHCVDWKEVAWELEHEMIIVIQRCWQGLTETTLKQVEADENGDVILLSRSDDDQYRAPITVRNGLILNDDCEVTIQALVVGHYQPYH